MRMSDDLNDGNKSCNRHWTNRTSLQSSGTQSNLSAICLIQIQIKCKWIWMHCNQLQFNQMANALTFKCNAVYNKAHWNKIDNWNYKIHCMSPLWPNIESENTVLYCCTFIQGRLCFLPSFRDHSLQGGLDFRLFQKYICSWFILNF